MNLFKGTWNLRRIVYLLGGVFFVILAVKDQTWWLIPFGLYFVAMAVIGFGCAAGNCDVIERPRRNSSPLK